MSKKLNKLIEKAYLWEMASVAKQKTNLSVLVYVSPKQGSHGPRIKFLNDYGNRMIPTKLVSMTIEDNPKVVATNDKIILSQNELDAIRQWIILNKQVLLDLWNHKFNDESDAIQQLKKI